MNHAHYHFAKFQGELNWTVNNFLWTRSIITRGSRQTPISFNNDFSDSPDEGCSCETSWVKRKWGSISFSLSAAGCRTKPALLPSPWLAALRWA